MTKRKVVVVFPAYNGAKTLAGSLQSIAEQTFSDFEAVILENVSTDDTLAVAEAFCARDPRFSIVRNEEHVGAIENFAKAVEIGAERGEYFCLRACDDFSSSDFLMRLVEALDGQPAKLLAGCPTKVIGPADTKMKKPSSRTLNFAENYKAGDVPRNLTFPSEWIYGLFRSEARELLMGRWYELGNPWCFASYVVSEFVVRGLVTYVDGPTFDFVEGSGSLERYGAVGFRDRLRQRLQYTMGCYRLHRTLPPAGPLVRMKFFRMCWNDARRKTKYKLLWIF